MADSADSPENVPITPEDNRKERVGLETTTHLIKGVITLPRQGYRARFSDYLNRADIEYVPLTEAEKFPLSGGSPTKHSFIAVAKSSVLLAFPLNEDESRMRIEGDG